MNTLPKWVLGTVAGAVLLLFLGCILLAAKYSLASPPTPDDMPDIAVYVVSSVNGILATNLGAILGVSFVLGGFGRTLRAAEKVQWIAACCYVVIIVVTVVIWGLAGFEENGTRIVSVIPEVSRTGIGIVIGLFAAILGVQTTKMKGPGG